MHSIQVSTGFRLVKTGRAAKNLVFRDDSYVHEPTQLKLSSRGEKPSSMLRRDHVEALRQRKVIFMGLVKPEPWNDRYSTRLNLWHLLAEAYLKLVEWWEKGEECHFDSPHQLK
ncbi:unnamed protein product [Choristocarpus tenellus]